MHAQSHYSADHRSMLIGIDDLDERAWHILSYGLMHDPDCADVVAAAAAGSGEHSRQLSAMMIHANEFLDRPISSPAIVLPLPADAQASAHASRDEELEPNPFRWGKE